MPELGRAALVVALGLLLYAAVVGAIAALRGRRRLLESARNALFASFGAVAVASVVLLAALADHDFSLVYVAQHTSLELPLGYTLSAFWSGQEGSLLLWLLVLTGMGAAAVALSGRLTREVLPWTVPILAAVASFFAFLLVFVASPFATAAAPADGAGPNPSLQNPYMMAHPPLLYLGFVGLTIPYAFAMAALITGKLDEAWIVATRRWTIHSLSRATFVIPAPAPPFRVEVTVRPTFSPSDYEGESDRPRPPGPVGGHEGPRIHSASRVHQRRLALLGFGEGALRSGGGETRRAWSGSCR